MINKWKSIKRTAMLPDGKRIKLQIWSCAYTYVKTMCRFAIRWAVCHFVTLFVSFSFYNRARVCFLLVNSPLKKCKMPASVNSFVINAVCMLSMCSVHNSTEIKAIFQNKTRKHQCNLFIIKFNSIWKQKQQQ